MATREPIYAALASLVFNHSAIVANFKTTGRWLRHHEQVPGGDVAMPAIYLVQHPGEEHQRIGKGMDSKRTLKCNFVMYFQTVGIDAGGPLPATLCNAGLDAIDQCINIPGGPANTQTLGGLVEHVYMEGAVSIAEGLLQDHSIVAVPITILIP